MPMTETLWDRRQARLGDELGAVVADALPPYSVLACDVLLSVRDSHLLMFQVPHALTLCGRMYVQARPAFTAETAPPAHQRR